MVMAPESPWLYGDEITLVGTNIRRMGLYVCVNYSIYRYRERYNNAIYNTYMYIN